VLDALDITKLVQQLQEERAAVALNNFLLQEKGLHVPSADQSISKVLLTAIKPVCPGADAKPVHPDQQRSGH
jgi:hypothetical protein